MKRIIIADDDGFVRRATCLNIRAYYPGGIDEVEDGDKLVDAVKTGDYTAVFTDYAMGRMDGIEATRAIRGFNRDIPIFMLSGSPIEQEALEAGVTRFLPKPPSHEELRKILDSL